MSKTSGYFTLAPGLIFGDEDDVAPDGSPSGYNNQWEFAVKLKGLN
jgi:hypothetical protein